MLVHRLGKGRDIYLELFQIRRDRNKTTAVCLRKGLVLHEVGRNADDLALLRPKRHHHRLQGRGRAAAEEDILHPRLHAEALREVLCHRFPQRVSAHTAGIAVDADAALGVQKLMDAPVDLFGRRDRRIAEAEIIDLVRSEKLGLLPAVFKNLPDLIGRRSHRVCLSVEHDDSFFLWVWKEFPGRFGPPGGFPHSVYPFPASALPRPPECFIIVQPARRNQDQ